MAYWDDTREDWNARTGRSMYYAPATNRTEFYNHYVGGTPLGLAGKPHTECLTTVKGFQDFHLDGRGWSDIGYNGLVCQHGRSIEGRGLQWVGAHCPNHNASAYGIQFMVGGDEEPTDAAKNRMRALYDDLCDRSDDQLDKRGHRDGLATACPGDVVYGWVKDGMPSVSGGAQSVPYEPAPAPKPKPKRKKVRDKSPAFPLPSGWYYGPKSGPRYSVSGYYGHRDGLRRWQQRMKDRGWTIGVDGLYGPQTAKVARAFQSEKGLAVDGLIGATTWAAAWTEPVT